MAGFDGDHAAMEYDATCGKVFRGRTALQRRVSRREIQGFSLGVPQRLKANSLQAADAALKGPLFHGALRFYVLPIIVITLLSASCFHGSRPQHIGEAAPDFTVQDSDRKITLNQFRGDVVVLNFWASWCAPCQQETPSLISMQDRTRAKGVVVLGVSIDVDDDSYHRFLKQSGVNFVTVRDPDQNVSSMYGTHGWPETYIVDRQGVVRRKVVGPINWNAPDVIEFLSKL
jgi:cytochrome c biogenesis protein CcmG/thiol:disulfide interchange protein DsbE